MPDNKAAINQTVFLNPGETVYIVSVLTNKGSYPLSQTSLPSLVRPRAGGKGRLA